MKKGLGVEEGGRWRPIIGYSKLPNKVTWVSWVSCVTDRNSDIGQDGVNTGIFYEKIVSVVVCGEETNLTGVHVALCVTSSVASKHIEVR